RERDARGPPRRSRRACGAHRRAGCPGPRAHDPAVPPTPERTQDRSAEVVAPPRGSSMPIRRSRTRGCATRAVALAAVCGASVTAFVREARAQPASPGGPGSVLVGPPPSSPPGTPVDPRLVANAQRELATRFPGVAFAPRAVLPVASGIVVRFVQLHV